MKAVVCHQYGPLESLKYEDVETPVVGAEQVLIKVRAIGVNYADALLVQGQYQAKPSFPFVPGCEFCGEVESLGKNVRDYHLGDRVFCFSPDLGAYAEYVLIDAKYIARIPEGIPDHQAAGILCAHGTAHHGLKQRAQLKPEENLLVLGAAGGTGLAAVQIGKAMGARVIAVCSNQDKLDLAKKNGADELVNYKEEDLKEVIRSLTHGKGIDVVFDPVGGNAFDICARSMARNGRLLVIGFTSGEIPQFPVNLALVKEFAVMGVFWGSFTQHEPHIFEKNMQELLDWYEKGEVWVEIDKEYPLRDAAIALNDLIQRKSAGKLILSP